MKTCKRKLKLNKKLLIYKKNMSKKVLRKNKSGKISFKRQIENSRKHDESTKVSNRRGSKNKVPSTFSMKSSRVKKKKAESTLK